MGRPVISCFRTLDFSIGLATKIFNFNPPPLLNFLCLIFTGGMSPVFTIYTICPIYQIYPIYPISIQYIQYILTRLIYFKRLPTSCKGVRCGRIFVFVAGGIPIYFKRFPTSWVDLLYPSNLYWFVVVECQTLWRKLIKQH